MTATPDVLTVKDTSTSFTPAPEGQHQAVAVDVIDLGERVEQFQSNPARIVHKVALVYQIDEENPETGKPFEIAVEKTVSFNSKAGLRKWVEAWRGKAYTEDEAKQQGAPLHKMVGVNGFIVIEHKVSKGGRTYGLASNIMPKPKNVPAISPDGYERADYWTKRKEEYAAGVATHRALQQTAASYDEMPAALQDEDESDLPFDGGR
jgi:hypothetical protein